MSDVVKFTHPNTDRPISILRSTVQGWYYMDSHKSTVLVLSGGTIFPVKETEKEIEAIIKQGEKNVRTKLPKRKG